MPTVCSPKITAEVDSLAAGPGVPVPASVTACGLPPPSSLINKEAIRLPAAAGVKMTLTVQFAPAPRLLPQVLVLLLEKSPAFAPTDRDLPEVYSGAALVGDDDR